MMPARIAPPEQHREIDRVERHHGDAVFALQAEPGQHRRDARALLGQLAVGQPPRGIDERDFRRAPFRDVAIDHVDGGVVGVAHGVGCPGGVGGQYSG